MHAVEAVESVVESQLKPANEFPDFSIGDTLNVHVRIIEGDKERVQVYQGVLISARGRGINRTITVRRIVANEGVERVFPLHSPRIAKINFTVLNDGPGIFLTE
jgi:large subunit ribosomal protein L19